MKPCHSLWKLFDRHALGQVPGLVHIQAADGGDVIGQHLQRDDRHDRAEHPGCFGHPQDVVGHLLYQLIAFGCHGDDDSAARLGLLDLRDHLLMPGVFRRKAQHRHILIDQRDWAVFHLARRVALGVDVGNLLEFQRAFVGNRHVDAAPEIQTIADVFEGQRNLLDFRFAVQCAADQVGNEAQVGDQFAAGFLVDACRAGLPAG